MEKKILKPSEAAEYLGRTTAALSQLRHRRMGPAYIKSGNNIRYRVTDLDAFLDAGRVEPVR